MGLLDNMTDMVSRGMDYADRRSQIMHCQSQLTALDRQKTQLLADLGKAVLLGEGEKPEFAQAYGDRIGAIAQVESQEGAVRQQLEDLRRAETLVTPQTYRNVLLSCAGCGAAVSAGASFCPSCGTGMEATRQQYRQCPSCGAYYGTDTAFCERCGTAVVTPSSAGGQDRPASDAAAQPEPPACPRCGTPARAGASFCGECGAPLS